MGSQVATVQILFASLQPVLLELPKLIHAAHNYNIVIELVLELLSSCARIMLIFLSQVANDIFLFWSLALIFYETCSRIVRNCIALLWTQFKLIRFTLEAGLRVKPLLKKKPIVIFFFSWSSS
jgi:hypothetical protein